MKKRKNFFVNLITFKWLFVGLTIFYKRIISPILPKACIYYPSCSDYMLESLEEFGALKGVILGIKRLLRCLPWREGGFDPVPYNPKGDIKWLY